MLLLGGVLLGLALAVFGHALLTLVNAVAFGIIGWLRGGRTVEPEVIQDATRFGRPIVVQTLKGAAIRITPLAVVAVLVGVLALRSGEEWAGAVAASFWIGWGIEILRDARAYRQFERETRSTILSSLPSVLPLRSTTLVRVPWRA